MKVEVEVKVEVPMTIEGNLSLAKAAKLLGIHVNQLKKYVDSKQFGAVKIGTRYRTTYKEVIRFKEEYLDKPRYSQERRDYRKG